VIGSFRQETNADDWAETRADIARLLRRYDDAALPQEFIRLFRPGIDPAARQGSTRQWLARIDELLRPCVRQQKTPAFWGRRRHCRDDSRDQAARRFAADDLPRRGSV
jgi:hypothetical protein